MKKLSALLLVAIITAGCASTDGLTAKKVVGMESGSTGLKEETKASVDKKIIDGKTTKTEIIKMFGEKYHTGESPAFKKNSKGASTIDMDNMTMLEAWTYLWDEADTVDRLKAFGASLFGAGSMVKQDSKSASLLVVFNADGTVNRHEFKTGDKRYGGL